MAELNNPFLFVCGVPRSGTTLLQRMLNHHPELAVANDSHFIPRALELTDKSLIERARRGEPIPLTPELIEKVFGYHRFHRLGIDAQAYAAIVKKCSTYTDLVSGIYGALAEQSQKRLAGEKTPDYVRRLPMLHGLFPTAKQIHLVRDGRNVALSLMDWATPTKGPGRIGLWDESPVAVCALWWRWLVMAAKTQQNEEENRPYLEVGYENLVSHPESELNRICQFLELSYRDQMLDYHHGKAKTRSLQSAKSAWLAPQQGLRDWRVDMPGHQAELFEVLAGDALQVFGYEVGSTTRSSRTIATAQRYLTWWNENFLPKHQPAESLTHPVDKTQRSKSKIAKVAR